MSLNELSQLLPLPTSELQQVLDYAASLSKQAAAEHFSNLLGDSPAVVEFISSFNSRRKEPHAPTPTPQPARQAPSSTIEAVPRPAKGGAKKKKPQIHALPPRKIEDKGPAPGTVYNKKTQDLDYLPSNKRSDAGPSIATSNVSVRTASPALPVAQKRTPQQGFLISDGPPSKTKPSSNNSSGRSTPNPNSKSSSVPTKVSITGGMPMSGASTALTDLEAAIRALEITTNPTLQVDAKDRRCNCVATRHPLQTAAPNCLSCGKVICMKEGLGPCTFCGTPLLSAHDTQAIMRELRAERGREKMAADRDANRRADVSRKPAPFTKPREGPPGDDSESGLSEAEAKARQHRDKLLNFQAQNAKRTTVRDEVSDFDVSAALSGKQNMWSTPEERATELRRQQKLLREMEWNARPEYEKRRQVVSIDLVGGRVVKRMAAVERPPSPEPDNSHDTEDTHVAPLGETTGNSQKVGNRGTFSQNPLVGGLIKPVYRAKEDAKDASKGKGKASATASDDVEQIDRTRPTWRRVQDDLEDNESMILDGGVFGYGGGAQEASATGDEPERG